MTPAAACLPVALAALFPFERYERAWRCGATCTGVVARMRGRDPSAPTEAVRGDIDALEAEASLFVGAAVLAETARVASASLARAT